MQRALLAWAAEAGRQLPWRLTRDPWAILVSEVMLQQTQVARVIPAYERFLSRFPTLPACAAAPVAEVVQAWAGLGYNRRAVNLHRAAKAVVARHTGRLPADRAALEALPGIGPYTARAVMAFAFEADVGVVETNSARVLARAVSGRAMTRSHAQAAADALVPGGEGWAWNSAVLDLGALVCTSRAPACQACPWVATCAWARAGRPAPDPAKGSGGTSERGSRFEGSDRQARGRLVAALRRQPLSLADAANVAGWSRQDHRLDRVVGALVADGLAVVAGDRLSLPPG